MVPSIFLNVFMLGKWESFACFISFGFNWLCPARIPQLFYYFYPLLRSDLLTSQFLVHFSSYLIPLSVCPIICLFCLYLSRLWVNILFSCKPLWSFILLNSGQLDIFHDLYNSYSSFYNLHFSILLCIHLCNCFLFLSSLFSWVLLCQCRSLNIFSIRSMYVPASKN